VHQAPWPVTQDEFEHPSMSLVLKSNDELLLLLNQKPNMTLAVDCLLELHKRQALVQTMPFSSPAITAYKVLESVYTQALLHENWGAVRQLFAILMQPTTDLATYIADITVRQRQLILGEAHKAEIHIRNPLHQNEIFELIERISPNPIAKVIYHELIAITGALIRAKPDYFNGVRTIRLHHFALLCAKQAGMDEGEDAFLTLAQLSPHQLYRIFERVLDQKHQAHNKGMSGFSYGEMFSSQRDENDLDMTDLDWFDWRLEQGMITKLPEAFLTKIWSGLKHAPSIIFGDKQSDTVLDCQLTLKSMTAGEDTFALLIERLTYDIHPSWYKSLIFEALNAYLLYCETYPDCTFEADVNLPLIVSHCVEEFVRQNSHHDYSLTEEENAALIEFAQLPPSKINQYLLLSVAALHG
jgi:phosphorylase kinase alpha/beta subunit